MAAGQSTVWCLLGKKAGDNTQVLALARELGWGYVEKQVAARPYELLVHIGHRATLAGIDITSSSPLQAPWPDVVISAGRRNEPVAQWIKGQSNGKTRLVHMGRPWAPLSAWDLIVTTPQYFLPRQSHIVHNSLPLHCFSGHALASAGDALRPQLAHLPRPWVAVLMGGDSGRFVMTLPKGGALGALAADLASASGGSVLATDSPRTPLAAGNAFQQSLPEPHFCYRCEGDDSAGQNPYWGLLALADAFIVTGESMSMLAEAAETGRPMFIFDIGDGATPWWTLSHNYRYKPLSFRLGSWLGPRRMRRDIGNIQNTLVDSGRAQWLSSQTVYAGAQNLREQGSGSAAPYASAAAAELEATAQAVRRLVTGR